MTNNILALGIAGIISFGAYAQSSRTEFTYAQGEVSMFGKSKREVVDVAMCIDQPSFAGMKLTHVKAYISNVDGISNTSIWLSRDLTLNGKDNVPDIGSYSVTPVPAMLESMNVGLIEYGFEEPFILTEEPLYIGYSLEVIDNTLDSQKKPVILADNINPDGFFLHMSKSVMKWMEYSESAGGVAYIVATLEGDIPDYSLDLVGSDMIFAENGKDFQATFQVTNKGSQTIENIGYTYSFDKGENLQGFVNLPSVIEPGVVNEVNISLPFTSISGPGRHELDLRITALNGSPNEAANPSITSIVNVMPFVPVHRPLVEEYTGLWCGYCPRGYLAMEMIAEQFGKDEVSICYHYDDEMQVTPDTPIYVAGLPKASIDRKSEIDPYYGSYSDTDFGISIDLQDAMNEFVYAAIDVEASLVENTVKVDSYSTFILDLDEANYEVGYVLVCNGLSDKFWMQTNYYAGSPYFNDSPLYVLTTWPEMVFGLVFNDVAVDASAMMGIENSIPTSVSTGTPYHNSYTFNIAGNELIQNRDNLVVTAFVIDKNTGRIVNANKCGINTSGVNSLETEGVIINTEFYDLTGKKISNPASGIFIKKETFSNGSIKTSKVFIP